MIIELYQRGQLTLNLTVVFNDQEAERTAETMLQTVVRALPGKYLLVTTTHETYEDQTFVTHIREVLGREEVV